METTRGNALMEAFNDFKIFYNDLNRLIMEYEAPNFWENTASASWAQTHSPGSLLYFQQYLYICRSNLILTCSPDGKIIQEKKDSPFKDPFGIDIDEKNSILYIADQTHVTTTNLKLELIFAWKLPEVSDLRFRGLKFDENLLYLTIDGIHQVFVCNSQNGKLLRTFGYVNHGLGHDSFYFPRGLTVDNKYCYICDCANFRVQILTKENGSYFSKWGNEIKGTEQGQFDHPHSIYNHLEEDIIYVGDNCSVQLFKKNGVCIQRLGDNYYFGSHQKSMFHRVPSLTR